MSFEECLDQYCAILLRHAPELEQAHKQATHLQNRIDKLVASMEEEVEPLSQVRMADKTVQYTLINYLTQLLPSEQQVWALLQGSPENPEFYGALKQVHKNVSFSQQVGQSQVFEFLLLVYNYALQKILFHCKQLIFQLIEASGAKLDYSKLQISLLVSRGTQQKFDSVRQFQLVQLLNPVALQILSHLRENKRALFVGSFQTPYLQVMNAFYVQNLKMSCGDGGQQFNEIANLYMQQTRRALPFTAGSFYILLDAPSNTRKATKILEGQQLNCFSLQAAQRICNLIPAFEDTNELSLRLSQFQMAPLQVQIGCSLFPELYNCLLQRLKLQRIEQLATEAQDDPAAALAQQLTHICIQILFETELQVKLFQVDWLLNETFQSVRDHIMAAARNYLQQYGFYLPGMVFVSQFLTQLRVQISKYDVAAFCDTLLLHVQSAFTQAIDNFIAQQTRSLEEKNVEIDNMICLIDAGHSDQIVVPGFAAINAAGIICCLAAFQDVKASPLFEAFRASMNPDNILLQFQAVQEQTEAARRKQPKARWPDPQRIKLYLQARELNSYGVLEASLQSFCKQADGLLEVIQQRKTELMEGIIAQLRLLSNNMATHARNLVEEWLSEPFPIIGAVLRRQIMERAVQ